MTIFFIYTIIIVTDVMVTYVTWCLTILVLNLRYLFSMNGSDRLQHPLFVTSIVVVDNVCQVLPEPIGVA